MNTAHPMILGQRPKPVAAAAVVATSTKKLATLVLAAGVAALVVLTDQMIDRWAQSHLVPAWLALWFVVTLAIGLLRGVSRDVAQKLMNALDTWSVQLARRRADERLWAMAQTDVRLMRDLQVAMDRAAATPEPAQNLESLKTGRAARLVRDRLYYI